MADDNKQIESKEPHKIFVAICNVRLGGKDVAPGGKVSLTREEFDELKAARAIEGDWPAK